MSCEFCNDTGYYGDNCPGIAGNSEWHECDECTVSDRCRRTHVQDCGRCDDFGCGDNTNTQRIDTVKLLISNLTAEQRVEVFNSYCCVCGSDNPMCPCEDE